MARGWVGILFLGTVMAASLRETPPMDYDKVRDFVVQQYNMESGSEFLFRMVSADTQPNWNATSDKIQSFSLTLRETVCKGNPEKDDVAACDYKEKGVTKACAASYHYFSASPPLARTMILCRKQ